jgi:hypothetical protein
MPQNSPAINRRPSTRSFASNISHSIGGGHNGATPRHKRNVSDAGRQPAVLDPILATPQHETDTLPLPVTATHVGVTLPPESEREKQRQSLGINVNAYPAPMGRKSISGGAYGAGLTRIKSNATVGGGGGVGGARSTASLSGPIEDYLLPARNPPRYSSFDVFPLSLFVQCLTKRGKDVKGKKGARARAKLRNSAISHNLPLEISLYLVSHSRAFFFFQILQLLTRSV